ncbi:Multidrug resistance-associated protein 4 [Nowakowskiella sp. JEL0078]|nr:Multidrug resistance-associated protein 4 [Nowakowskiella sp. JEL0078]
MVSFSRIQEFLSLPEITQSEEKINAEEAFLNKFDSESALNETKTMIAIENCSFGWPSTNGESNPTPTLQNICFKLRANEIVGICGQVGSGKTSLLHAVLDEMEKINGESAVRRRFSDGKESAGNVKIAYVSQSPWITSGSIKENILFGSEFSEKWFWEVIRACALDTDLDIFPNRENTVIGERGVTLSGGQRARLSLARAVYYNADIYLLDDPLSAVDTKVGRHLFENCINGILRDKARLLVTHQLQFNRDCDSVLLLEGGKITAFGDFQTVINTEDSKFAAVLRNFSQNINKSEKIVDEIDSIQSSEIIEENESKKDIVDDWEPSQELSRRIPRKETLGWTFMQTILPLELASYIFPMVFAILVVGITAMSNGRTLLFYYVSLKSSRRLFSLMLDAVIRSPMSFFQFNPHGRLMNRFSKDINLVDEMLPGTFFDFAQSSFMVLGTLILSVIVIPWVIIAIPVITILFYFIRRYFMSTSRQIKRIESITRSPVYSSFPATLEGLSTIRAFDAESRLDVMSECFVFFVSFLSVVLRQSLNLTPGIVGLLLSYTLQIIALLQWSVIQSAEIENMMVSVERVLEYTKLEPEAPPHTDIQPPETWPDCGDINIHSMSLTYPLSTKPALNSITVHLKPGQRCGIVGWLVEPEPSSGAIFIDGIDTSTIGLTDLRSRISIIPQEPFCFRGTLRFNIDPFARYSDEELWKALDAVELKHVVEAMPEKLDAYVTENGGNWSFGERQLICLARAILRSVILLFF